MLHTRLLYFQYKPFIYKHVINNNSSSPQYRYTGFCIDLFNRIAEQLDFTYDIYETPDSLFGSLNDDGTWNGAINELIEKVNAPMKYLYIGFYVENKTYFN